MNSTLVTKKYYFIRYIPVFYINITKALLWGAVTDGLQKRTPIIKTFFHI